MLGYDERRLEPPAGSTTVPTQPANSEPNNGQPPNVDTVQPVPARMSVQPPAANPIQTEPVGPPPPVQTEPSTTPQTAAASSSPANSQSAQPPKPAQPAKPRTKPKPTDKKQAKFAAFGGADSETKEYIMDNLSMLLATGVSVGESLESIISELPKKSVKKVLQRMLAQIDEGAPFARAIADTGLFNPSVVSLIKVGEESGRLPENLHVISAQMHKTNMMTAKIKSAMLYPAFLVGLLFVVGTGVGVFLLPKLLGILSGLDVKVGLITRLLIIVGTFMGKYGILVTGGTVGLIFAIILLVKYSRRARKAAEAVAYHVPGIKKLLFETEVARFGFILGTLLEAGLPVVGAIETLASSMATYRYRQFASQLATSIEEGNSFSKTFDAPEYKKLLPATIRQLVISAEKSGNLSKSLLKIGEVYEDKADITSRNLETLLEPIILVIIAVCVLLVALAVILPIYSLVGGINQH